MSDISTRATRCPDCQIHDTCFASHLTSNRVHGLDMTTSKSIVTLPNEYLFRAGEETRRLHIVCSGSLKAYRLSPDGREVVLGFFLPGDIVGLSGMSSPTHSFFAMALETTHTREFTMTEFQRAIKNDPVVAEAAFQSVSSELDLAQHLLFVVGHLEAKARVADFVLSISHRLLRKKGPQSRFKLPMDRRDIANHLGVTTETVSRALSQLQRERLIDVEGKHMRVLDRRALERMARPGDQSTTRSVTESSPPIG